jgi:hypothetical protein
MKSPFQFLIKPKGQEYNNEIEIAGQKIVINSTLDNHMNVNRFAEVISVPTLYKGFIKPGNTIVVHHNIFRIYHDMKGRPRKSPNYFKDDIYMIMPYQFYLCHDGHKWMSVDDYCFVAPTDKENTYLYEEGEEENTGFVVYGNPSLDALGVSVGDKVNFTKNSEYEFTVNDQKMYRMRTRDICVLLNE